MPSLLDKLFRPTRTAPPPVNVDLGRVMLVGTAAWAVAVAVTTVLALTGTASWTPSWVCATGVFFGLLGILWARHNPPAPQP